MNDFYFVLVDWDAMICRFEATGTQTTLQSARDAFDGERLFSTASSFWEEISADESSSTDRSIVPGNFSVGSFKLWSAFGAVYGEIRGPISSEVREVYDAMYLPFIAPWVDDAPSDKQMCQLPESMDLLKAGGLCIAISPKHCETIARYCDNYTFSYLTHHRVSRRVDPPPLPKSSQWAKSVLQSTDAVEKPAINSAPKFSWFNQLLDITDPNFGGLHASITELTEGWRKLFIHASASKRGILGFFEI